jgi:hypothetical protein
MAKEWQTGKPPHNVVVEVEFNGEIVQGRAIWGDRDKGVIPHWELSNGIHLSSDWFDRWRHLG